MQTNTKDAYNVTPIKHFMTVARKGQITLPAVIREALHIKEGDKIAVELYGEAVKVTPICINLRMDECRITNQLVGIGLLPSRIDVTPFAHSPCDSINHPRE